MAASAPIPKTIYLGAFVHSVSLSELEICERGAIGVDEAGLIQFVERGVEDVEVLKGKEGWGSAEVVSVEGDGWFFPGFVGELHLSFDDLGMQILEKRWICKKSTQENWYFGTCGHGKDPR